MGAHVIDHLRIDALRRAPQRQLAQRGQIAGHEEMLCRALGRFGEIDLSLFHPLQKVFRRQIDQLHVVGAVENGIRNRLADAHMRDLRDHIVQAFQMLHIERGVNVDAVAENLLDVLIPLGMAAARRIGVRQFIDQNQLGLAHENGVEVHFRQHAAFVEDAFFGNDVEALGQDIGFDAAMRFHHADDDVARVDAALARLRKHLIGLADAGRGAQEYLEAPTPFHARLLQQGLWRRAGSLFGHSLF